MKIITAILIIISTWVQNVFNPNPMSEQEFMDITLNGKTIAEFKATNGQENTMKLLLANSFRVKHSDDPFTLWSAYGDDQIGLSFEDYNNDGQYYLQGFRLKNSSVTMTIKGISIKIGDNISKLGNVVFNTRPDGARSILFCVKIEDGKYAGRFWDEFLVFEFDQQTQLITKIEYIVPT